jgi:hypothetical protein
LLWLSRLLCCGALRRNRKAANIFFLLARRLPDGRARAWLFEVGDHDVIGSTAGCSCSKSLCSRDRRASGRGEAGEQEDDVFHFRCSVSVGELWISGRDIMAPMFGKILWVNLFNAINLSVQVEM